MRICYLCQKNKPIAEFYISNRSRCKSCIKIKAKEWAKKNPQRRVEVCKTYQDKHIKTIRQKRMEYQYGLSYEEFAKLLEVQGGGCAICKTKDSNTTNRKRDWCIDHDHSTGEVRGLLCDNCNVGIARLKDNIDILNSAIKYLKYNYSHMENL